MKSSSWNHIWILTQQGNDSDTASESQPDLSQWHTYCKPDKTCTIRPLGCEKFDVAQQTDICVMTLQKCKTSSLTNTEWRQINSEWLREFMKTSQPLCKALSHFFISCMRLQRTLQTSLLLPAVWRQKASYPVVKPQGQHWPPGCWVCWTPLGHGVWWRPRWSTGS